MGEPKPQSDTQISGDRSGDFPGDKDCHRRAGHFVKWTERGSLAGLIDDEQATRIVSHLLPMDHPPFIVVGGPVDDAAEPQP